MTPVTKSGPLFFNETALHREVQRLGSAAAQMFGDWLHHNIFYPAAKKRGDGHDTARALFQSREVADIQFDTSTGRIVLRGEIGIGTYRRLLRALDEQPKAELLEVDSPGGYVIEGFALARLIKQRGLNTVAFRYCDSACTLIFAAGKHRYLGPKASMGFHRSYVYGKPIIDGWSVTKHRMSRFLRERGVEMDFIELAFSYGGDDLWLPKQRQMFDAKYATARWREPK